MMLCGTVALLAEGVDRNCLLQLFACALGALVCAASFILLSPSSRRVWIENGWREAISLPAVWQGVGEGTPPAALGDPRARKRRFTHAEFFKGLDMQQ